MTKAVLLVFLAALWSPSLGDLSTAPITTDWIPRVSRKMTTFAESQTGALQLVQEYEDRLSFTQTQIDGETQLHFLTQAAGDQLKKCREILHRNKAEIEASHALGTMGGNPVTTCCNNLGQLEYDPRFLQQIINDTCATFNKVPGARNTIRPHVYDTMTSNLHEMSGVTWQYYGAKEGEYHQFPKSDRSCDGNAHIFSANGYSSAIFHHLQHNQGHSFKLESTDVLDRETRWWERGVKEAIYERMYNPTLNREGGLRVDLSGTWDLALPAPRTDNT
ncbi:hypothetical protein Bbelb_107630 [Branchiostoma belcheri]|nr:hypothetical protein Bbelb_107630 [Branchiostoma belcheri]